MASTAIFRGCVGREADFERHMRFVAILAGGCFHAFDVWFVTIETRGTIAMFGVAGGAVEGGMD